MDPAFRRQPAARSGQPDHHQGAGRRVLRCPRRCAKAHETQIDPDSHWFAIPHDLEAEIWGTDDYELARSLVDAPLPEDDLFAGVRERVTQ